MLLAAVHLYALLALQTHKVKPKETGTAAEVKRFVQGFYDWYTPRALKGDAETLALKTKADMFSPELRRALNEDRIASSKVPDEIVGLDFDPFLASQDPYPVYTVRKIEHKVSSWLASVYGSSPGEKATDVAVVAKVEKGKHGWRFTNFLYGKDGDLLGVLHTLKKDREKPGK